ncbi:probable ATP-dependent RNA helicase DDX47 [Symsagittifera roscoffensis]|uniref:probable ATP-dependent RNA helicase DDX47 n=1 Tax=Symsagittifera roscoffensis TaxID=84072 RepID=UPI00307C00EA
MSEADDRNENGGVENEVTSFSQLGIKDSICKVCEEVGWTVPTKIQRESIPHSIQGRDVIGLAETGSGKTGAFALPILQDLLEKGQKLFALILTPTRELAFQISEHFEALGSSFGVKSVVIVGGVDQMTQSLQLAKRPHIIIATPGRLVDHLENTKGFSLKTIKHLVMDEADRILNSDFEKELEKILAVCPKERTTYLFSATMTKKVQKLERASLTDPIKCEVSSKYQTVEKLLQYYLFIPSKYKDCYLVYLVNELQGQSVIIFCATCANTQRVALLLRNLGFTAIPLHGQMNQSKRLGALNKFKAKSRSILLATDVASRGLDIPHVDVVINFDIPSQSKDYIHRVGRTARAGRAGKAITVVTQYDVELYLRLEHDVIHQKLQLYPGVDEQAAMQFMERVSEAQVMAKRQMKELDEKKGGKGSRGARGENSDDEGDSEAVVGNFKVKKKTKLASGGGGGGGKVTKKKFKK